MATIDDIVSGKLCLITGATSGIGRVTALELARQGAQVVIVGRDRARCDDTVQQIRTQTGNAEVHFLRADLSSQQQIRQLAQQFRERYRRLDVLVNNAGAIWFRRQLTVDGLEMTFAVNHLAYFLLTHLLLDMLKSAGPARIVNVSSNAHTGVPTLPFGDLMGEGAYAYSGWRAYCQSKLANVLFTYELARRLQGCGVTANVLHPGFVATGFASKNGLRGWVFHTAAKWFALSPEQGARTVIYLASSPEVAGVSGRYFVREKITPSSKGSYDEAAAAHLWEVSEKLTGTV